MYERTRTDICRQACTHTNMHTVYRHTHTHNNSSIFEGALLGWHIGQDWACTRTHTHRPPSTHTHREKERKDENQIPLLILV